MVNQYKKINNLAGWLVFGIAAFTYISTVEATASFWDCGEFISTAYKLEVGHPPGAPLFQMIGRFFTLFGGPSQAAWLVNVMSALCSAFTILFLFWTITAIAKKIAVTQSNNNLQNNHIIAIILSAAVGSLAYTFSDSFWFSAVEAEVYAMSSFFTAIVIWAIFKWDAIADETHANRWIIFIAFIIGLSVGVHLLNLLAIPAICYVYYFRKHTTTRNGFIITGIVSLIILGVLQIGVILKTVKLAGSFELFFVNTIGMPRNGGIIMFILTIIALIILGLKYAQKKQNEIAHTAILCFAFIIIGYSSFTMIFLRSNANPPMDENNPENALSLLSYLSRDQYGDFPVLYGQYFNAPLDPQQPYVDGAEAYYYDETSKKYIMSDDGKNKKPNYDKRFCGLLARMWSSQPNHVSGYKQYIKRGIPIKITNNRGEEETLIKPTFGENLNFMLSYQFNHMYLRYFMWNFVGRQNDFQSYGSLVKGNWESGVPIIDKIANGNHEKISPQYAKNKAKNHYYALPLILGLIGLFFQFKQDNKNAFIVFILFLLTGLAINVYLNVPPYQPRERDYAYAGSYYAFAIWIGLGVYAIYDFLQRKINPTTSAILAGLVSLLAVPTIMAKENWDDHNRSQRYFATDFARNYLNSCAPNSIIFTNGDNDTFPLWYAQEVEGIRTDVRVVNLSLAQMDWYINQLRQRYYNSPPVKLTLTADNIRGDKRNFVPVYPRPEVVGNIDLKDILNFVASEDQANKLQSGSEQLNYIPTKNLSIAVNYENFKKNGGVISTEGVDKKIKLEIPSYNANYITPIDTSIKIQSKIDVTLTKSYITKNEMLIYDIIASNNWERPIYWAVSMGDDYYMGLQDNLQLEGLTYRLVPFNTKNKIMDGQTGLVNTKITYDNIMKKFVWGNMNADNVYIDENVTRMSMNLRNTMGRLASQLAIEGDTKKALEVAERCASAMPVKNIPLNYFSLNMVEVYYRCNEIQKGNDLTNDLFENYVKDFEYYNSFRKDKSLDFEKQQCLGILQKLEQVTKQYKQDVLNKKISTKFSEIVEIYSASAPQQSGGPEGPMKP